MQATRSIVTMALQPPCGFTLLRTEKPTMFVRPAFSKHIQALTKHLISKTVIIDRERSSLHNQVRESEWAVGIQDFLSALPLSASRTIRVTVGFAENLTTRSIGAGRRLENPSIVVSN